jgi:hypothetical protein
VVAFWTMVVEAGVVVLLLAFRGAAALPVFVAYFILNGAIFLFLFQPLLVGGRSLPVPVLESMVVLIDGAVIKLLATLGPFQGDGYERVTGHSKKLPCDQADSVAGPASANFVDERG